MKKIAILLLVLIATPGSGYSQTLSPAEREAIIKELRQQILDSLRKDVTVIHTAEDSLKTENAKPWKGNLELSAYIEAYYLFDINNPASGNGPGFIYSHNRHNEFNVNLAFVKLNYTAARLRANIALMAGTYSNANLSAEPGVLKNVFEANAGINLTKKKQLWLDAGIFASHIGFESAVGKDCWNLTRSILADNSPYYESGIKLTYTSDNGKFLASGLVLNGWQRIQKVGGNSFPSFGWQIQGKPNDKILINSSSFIGTDKPDSTRRMRYFHNLYAIFNATGKLGITLGFDIGAEQKTKAGNQYDLWYSPVFIIRYAPIEKLAIAARFEYYSDRNGVIVATGTPNGFETFGYSVNLDVIPFANAMIRMEGRMFQNRLDEIYEKRNGSFTKVRPSAGFCFAYSFAHQFK
ncbi:MAG TPA: porin [Chitinophagales bacterium]|nr:porin [Chitinophagales bacterium]